MAFLQRGTNNYFGFMPAFTGVQARTTLYTISSSNPQINPGDVMVFTSSGIAGTVAPAPTSALAGAGIVGIAAEAKAASVGSSAATPYVNSSQMLLIYDDPETIFVACDTTSFCISSTAGIGKNVGIKTSGPEGSTGAFNIGNAFRSVMCLSGNTTSSALTLPFKLLGLHPVESGYSSVAGAAANATTDVRKWLVKINNHVYAQGQAVSITS